MNDQDRSILEVHGAARRRGAAGTAQDPAEDARRLPEFGERQWREFESNPRPIRIFDRESLRYLAVNDAALRLYGYTREEFLALTVRDTRHPSHASSIVEGAGRPDACFTYFGPRHHVKKSGEVVIVEIVAQDVLYHGRVARMSLVVDVTESRQAEYALRDSEARLELAVDHTGLGMWDWNLRTGTVWRHPRWARVLGYAPEEVPGDICMWREFCHPADWPQTQERLHEHFDGTTPVYRAHYRMRNRQGAWIWIGCRGTVIERDGDGTPLRMIGYIRNITERKRMEQALRESEERFRQLAENIDEVFWIAAPGGDIVYVSPAYERVWGRSCASLYRDARSWLDAVHPADAATVAVAFEQMSAGRQLDMEFRIVRPDGTVRWIRERSYPMRRQDGSELSCGVAQDITSWKRTEEERLTHALKQRDALVREVHHRIKNHLQGIAGLLRSKAVDNPPAADTIGAAVAQLQSVAVVYGLQSELAESGVPLSRVLEAICTSAEGLSGSEIARAFAPGAGGVRLASAEAVPVAVALNELVFNAIEHGIRRARGSRIEVELREGAESAEIRIVNRGRLPAGFDYTRAIGTGTGLGLVRTLLGPAGNRLEFHARGGNVEVDLELRPPLVAAPVAALPG